tara:strand:- start:51485 stop:52216 length:732 start_codon:yes stop_codon:yes gene_type:complete
MTTIKEKDFVEIEFTGKLKEDDIIFDTTSEEEAKKSNVFDPNHNYGPLVVCIGQEQLLKGLDRDIVGKEVGKEYNFDFQPEDAFGKKNTQLIQLLNVSKFKKHDITPHPGLQVNIDGMVGTIKNVSGGRTMVDFNHPLSGKEVTYTVKVTKIITDDKEKLKGFLKVALNIVDSNVEVKEGKATLELEYEVPEEMKGELVKKIQEVIPTLKEIEFKVNKKQEKKEVEKKQETKEEQTKPKQPEN